MSWRKTRNLLKRFLYALDIENKLKIDSTKEPEVKESGKRKPGHTIDLGVKRKKTLAAIMLLALAIRLYFFLGLNLNDDLVYMNFAHQIAEGTFKLQPYIFSVRLLMNYPIAFFFWVFGVSDYSAAAYILLTSLGSVLVAFYLGKVLFDENTGLLAALLMSFFPVEVAYATTIVPDVPVAFFMGLSVLLFIIGERKRDARYMYLSGAVIGLGGLIKNLSFIILVFFGFHFIMSLLFPAENKRTGKPTRIRLSKATDALKYLTVVFLIATLLVISIEPKLAVSIGTYYSKEIASHKPEIQKYFSSKSDLPNGTAKIESYTSGKRVYWDAETNSYAKKEDRWGNSIIEDLEYNLHGNLDIHALSEDVKRLAVAEEPFDKVNCSKKEFLESYVKTEVGKVVCLKTIEGNLIKIEFLSSDRNSVTFRYEAQK